METDITFSLENDIQNSYIYIISTKCCIQRSWLATHFRPCSITYVCDKKRQPKDMNVHTQNDVLRHVYMTHNACKMAVLSRYIESV